MILHLSDILESTRGLRKYENVSIRLRANIMQNWCRSCKICVKKKDLFPLFGKEKVSITDL